MLPPPAPLPAPAALQDAEAFLRLFHAETVHAETGRGGLRERLHAARQELAASGRLTLSTDELAHGARVAWRNSTRCLGRGYWPALHVRDLRQVTAADEVFAQLVEHLRLAWNGGQVRAVMSVFGEGVRVLNPQLLRYAGYRQPGGAVLGDPQNVALTEQLTALGWAGPAGGRTAFDVLPLAVQTPAGTQLYPLPADVVQEVRITHPDCPALEALNLRWFALPVISDLRLEIAGQSFPCAPFNGWYLQTEIAARNLADVDRYNTLPAVAAALGLDTRRERSLWRDRALLELNVAVLHSFDAAGVRIDDHHSLGRRFVRFETQEARAGRRVYGRWSWLVPPLSPALSPVWHRRYEDRELRPNFFPQDAPWPQPKASACPVSGHRREDKPRPGCPVH